MYLFERISADDFRSYSGASGKSILVLVAICFVVLRMADDGSRNDSVIGFIIFQANGQPPGPIPHTKRNGMSGFFWKLSRIGERLSPYVGASCLLMGLHVLFFK